MGSIRKAPRTAKRPKAEIRWEARYRDPAGRQRTRTFSTQGEARTWLSMVEADVVRGTWVDPAGGKLLFSEWTEQWWSTVQNLRRSTRARDRRYLDSYIAPIFGDTPLGQITQPDVKAWAARLSARGLAPATVVKAYQILGKILESAVDGGMLPASPCHKVPLPRVERTEMRFLNPDEIERLASCIDPRYRALVLVGCYGGLRIGEMAALRCKRVDLFKGMVEVAEIADETDGLLTYGPPKTKASRRTISLPRSIVKAVDDHLAGVGHHRGGRKPDDLVFPAPVGGGLRVSTWRRRFWAPAVQAAGVARVRPHDMRHTAVAIWIATGADLLKVSRQAGHTSTSFTLDRYGHLFPESDERLVAGMERLLANVKPHQDGSVIALDGRGDA